MVTKPIENISIVGAGLMGTQIGLMIASHGYHVCLVDVAREVLERARQNQERELETWIANQQIDTNEKEAILGRLRFITDIKEGTSLADLVIEAVPERLEVKRELFAYLDRICPPDTILATNSSSIRVSLIEDNICRLDRVLNLHFYCPVYLRTVVELMRGTRTSDETIQRVWQFARSAGLTPLLVRKESTGFIFNRVWHAVKKECLTVVNDGIASHEDVDRAWMSFIGVPIGPFGMMDMVGLDVVRDIEMTYYRESGDESDAPPQILLDKIERGELGVKAGKGFYTYPDPVFEEPSWLKDSEWS